MTTANSAYSELSSIFERTGRLGAAAQTLVWESRTMMPPGGAETRGKVLSTLQTTANEFIVAPQVGDLLSRAESEEVESLDAWEAANLREMRRAWRLAAAVPQKLQAAAIELSARSVMVWQDARAKNDFRSFIEPLEALFKVKIEAARIMGDTLELAPYDALLDQYEPGVRTASVDVMFDELAVFLPDLLRKLTAKQNSGPQLIPIPGPFSIEKQRELSERLARLIGFDFHHGRMDPTVHPFASGVPGDVRITTRYNPNELLPAIMATVHETGHAMYESGLPMEWAFQPVRHARGGGMHESQSLMFEMQASRNSGFVKYLAQMLRETFKDSGDVSGPAWSDENILRLYRRVTPSFIRVEADEVTYPLHVILRYRLEQAILRGDLTVRDIPAAWNAESEKLLGIVPPTDTLGCLQDVHWASGLLGYFPTYTLGAMMAAQLFQAASREVPDVVPALGRGDFSPLLGWARKHVHSRASFYPTSDETLRHATGKPLSTEAFKTHLTERYLNG